jgi:DNA-binding response OmpR family regulator
MPSRKVTVLVVDDDVRMLRMMQRTLELEGYQALTATNGEIALNTFDEQSPDLVLLDIMMPGMDGYTVCQHIREFSQIPIIMVTAKGNDEEKVKGLDIGADDYITKPFSTQELMARVKAVLRRTNLQDEHPEPRFCSGDLIVDSARHRVILHNQEVDLTATEYKLLSYLAHHAGRLVALDQLLERVWGDNYIGEFHLIQVNMSRLRKKLRDNVKKPRYILTKPGIGYMMMAKTQPDSSPSSHLESGNHIQS